MLFCNNLYFTEILILVCILYNSKKIQYPKGFQIENTILQLQLSMTWLYETLLSSYTLPLWLLLTISFLSLISIVKFFMNFEITSKPEHFSYTEDLVYGAKWKWKWTKDEVSDIQCYCPKCDAILIYDDRSSHTKYTDVSKTDFICENCNSQIITSIHGGNKKYAINAVKREIERRIRTNEYKMNKS